MTTDDSVLETVLIVVGVFLAIPLLMMVVMTPMAGLAGWGHMSGGTGGWGSLLWSVIPLVILVGAIYILYANSSTERTKTDTALAELRTAYARGDLSDEEFQTRRENLRSE